jgi:sugar phosphate isomerase/epimerase
MLGINLWQFTRRHAGVSAMPWAGIAGLGYRAIETVGPIADARALRIALERHGLRCAARHIGLPDLDDLPALEASLAALGAGHVCNSGLRDWHRRTAEDYREAATTLHRCGQILADRGIRLHYHHHEFEFAPLADGICGMDILLDGCDPGRWDLCFDVGWAHLAGVDPLAFLRRHRGRIGYIHLRDQADDGRSVALGAGVLDLAGVVAEIRCHPRIRWAMVEQEPGDDPLADAASSMRTIRDLGAFA